MHKTILILGVMTLGLAACHTGDGIGSASQAVKLDVRCAADADCPAGFQCEDETEHGVSTSFCVSDPTEGTATGSCPAGFELEAEHEGTLCKPHGGGDDGAGGAAASDDSGGAAASDDSGGDAGADEPATGTAPVGAACVTSADCASGLECEAQVENGVSSSTCKPHGGKG